MGPWRCCLLLLPLLAAAPRAQQQLMEYVERRLALLEVRSGLRAASPADRRGRERARGEEERGRGRERSRRGAPARRGAGAVLGGGRGGRGGTRGGAGGSRARDASAGGAAGGSRRRARGPGRLPRVGRAAAPPPAPPRPPQERISQWHEQSSRYSTELRDFKNQVLGMLEAAEKEREALRAEAEGAAVRVDRLEREVDYLETQNPAPPCVEVDETLMEKQVATAKQRKNEKYTKLTGESLL